MSWTWCFVCGETKASVQFKTLWWYHTGFTADQSGQLHTVQFSFFPFSIIYFIAPISSSKPHLFPSGNSNLVFSWVQIDNISNSHIRQMYFRSFIEAPFVRVACPAMVTTSHSQVQITLISSTVGNVMFMKCRELHLWPKIRRASSET